MSASPSTTPPTADLEQLVASIASEVVRRLAAGRPAADVAQPPTAPAVPVAPSSPPAAAGATLTDKVIVLATVAKLPRDAGTLTVRRDAVITPSALEWLRDQGIQVQRAASASGSVQAAPTAPAFLLAACDLPGRSAALAAAVVRAVPNSQQLPSAGLTSHVAAFAEAATRSGSRGLLLTPRPAAAALIANRTRAVRAVAATSVREALTLAEECRATLVVVDPSRFAAGGLQRLAVEFAKQTHQELPADLAEASRPCSCSRTSKEASR